ncbi:hypothetical protein QPK32_07240 [Massilia sp. YIM B02763]|uniref:hypothetical protein n=1 Tax=Massilia sp. YIM B02763 TaxID=3050130 RepID=UPI0025B6CD13|nr:hypothetical protein [Massilia sp. YIM B02763]MDN4052867.1 hypothetical protein [Massilia sp. YIM B02763]
MNPTDHFLSQVNAREALYDQIERELRALTIARLDGTDGAPRQAVDEFADDYPLCFRMPPPPRRHQA